MGRSYCLLFVVLLSLSLNAQNPEWINYTNGQSVFQNQRFEHRYKNTPQQLEKYSFKGGTFADTELQFAFLHNKKLQERSLSKKSYSQSEMYAVDTATIYRTTDSLRYIYSYNANGKILEENYQQLKNDQWINSIRKIYTYNTTGNQLSLQYEQWTTDQWVIQWRSTSSYDADGKLLAELYEVWANGLWDKIVRYSYTYDGNGNLLLELDEDWKANQWVSNGSYTYTYDANRNRLSEIDADWFNNQWVNSYGYFYTYDAYGRLLTEVDGFYTNNQLINSTKVTYAYDGQNNVSSMLWERWANEQWLSNLRYSYTYDSNGNQLSSISEVWWVAQNKWVYAARITSSYNEDRNLLTELHETMSDNQQWRAIERLTFIYDANGNLLSRLYEQWLDQKWWSYNRYSYKYFQNKLWSESVCEVWENSTWIQKDGFFNINVNQEKSFADVGYKITLSYKQIITDARNEKEGIVKKYSLAQNFPNPFNPSTVISYQLSVNSKVSLKVYDVLGNEVATLVNEEKQPGIYEVSFDAQQTTSHQQLTSGVYFYQLRAGSFVQTKKMIVLK